MGPIKVESPDAISVPVTLAADAPIGYYPVQVRTADGLTSSLLMAVGDLPETNEVEPNDEPAQAQPINTPIVVQGTCAGTDRDHFRFEAKKGDRFEVEIEARRLGSGLDPALTVLDTSGKAISSDGDATHMGNDLRLTFVAPADGPYLVVVNDIKFAGAGDSFYRLKVGKLGHERNVNPRYQI